MRKQLPALLLAVAGAGVLLAVAAGISTLRAPPCEPTLCFGRGGDSVTLDPAAVSDGESAMVGVQIYEGLARLSDDLSGIEPCLATSWEESAGGREWTFHLRRGVLFHDGTAFTSEAVVFAVRRKMDPAHSYFEKRFAEIEQSLTVLDEVDAVDAYTVRFRLKHPFTPFLTAIANYVDIVSPAAVMKWGADFERHPVGTGPFKFVEWVPDDYILLEKNRSYWGSRPRLGRVLFRCIPDGKERLLALKTGAIQAMDGISPEDLDAIRRRPDLRVETRAGLNIGYLAMNVEKPPFDRVGVRRAINHAINKANLVKMAYGGLAVPATGPIPATMWGSAGDLPDYPYDPDQARRLLVDAGLGSGFETSLWVMPIPRPYMIQPQRIADAIKANLAAIGVRAKLHSCDWQSYLEGIGSGEHEMALIGYSADSPDPDDLLTTNLGSEYAVKPNAGNISFFRNPQVDVMLLRARSVLSPEKRAGYYRQVLEIVHEEAPWVPLAYAKQVLAMSRNLHGIVLTDVVWLRDAWMDE
ncbi:MAG: ABC transporter substrate-binding protein [Acidobacteriota bacterium]